MFQIRQHPNLVAAANNNRVWGLLVSGTGVGTVVDRNKVDNIYASSAGAGARVDVITCLQSQTVANATFTNNMISTNGGGASSDRSIFGILDLSTAPAISNYYFNSVNITGTATAANNTYASTELHGDDPLRDNIFADSRLGGTGFHVAGHHKRGCHWMVGDRFQLNLLFNANAANITVARARGRKQSDPAGFRRLRMATLTHLRRSFVHLGK
jgi:hypothetical protein